MVTYLQQSEYDIHMVQLMPLQPRHLLLHKPRTVYLTHAVPSYKGSSGKKAVKHNEHVKCLQMGININIK